VGDKFSRYCVLNRDGDVIEEGRIKTETGVVPYKNFKEAAEAASLPNFF
jgi:hypothetical protein